MNLSSLCRNYVGFEKPRSINGVQLRIFPIDYELETIHENLISSKNSKFMDVECYNGMPYGSKLLCLYTHVSSNLSVFNVPFKLNRKFIFIFLCVGIIIFHILWCVFNGYSTKWNWMCKHVEQMKTITTTKIVVNANDMSSLFSIAKSMVCDACSFRHDSKEFKGMSFDIR